MMLSVCCTSVQHNFVFFTYINHTTTTTVLQPIRDYLGEPVPEENLWTLWCKGRLTEADTPIWAPLHPDYPVPTSTIPHIFYRPNALPAAQPTASKH